MAFLYKLQLFDTIDSTQNYIKTNGNQLADYVVIWAEEQTQGRGRFDKHWNSVAYKDITYSLLLPLATLSPELWPSISLITGLAVVKTLTSYKIESVIKWPNDILVNNKKLCGILCESLKKNNKDYAIIGVGINVNRDVESLGSIDQPATSMAVEKGQEFNRREILDQSVTNIIEFINNLKMDGFASLRENIQQSLAYVGKKISVVDKDTTIIGTIVDISEYGHLIVEDMNSVSHSIASGIISPVP